LFSEIKKGATDIKTSVSQWGSADSLKYNARANLAKLFTDNNTTKEEKQLKKAYDAISGTTTGSDTALDFNYRFDKFWLRSQLEAHAASATQSVAPSSFWGDDVKPTGQTYYRKGSELYMRKASGAEVRVDMASPAFQSLKTEDKCLGTGFVDDPSGKKCTDYLRDCLAGKDVTQCKAYLDDEKYWDNAVNEVNNMLPGMAVQTLNAFEFPMEQVWDNTASRRLLKYKSSDAWMAGLVELTGKRGTPLTKTDVEKIAKNAKLIGYLNMLVNKVNSNPAILNKDYTSSATDSALVNNPDAFAGSRLHKMGVKAHLSAPITSVSSVDKLANGIRVLSPLNSSFFSAASPIA